MIEDIKISNVGLILVQKHGKIYRHFIKFTLNICNSKLENGGVIMKTAKTFLTLMYIHLVCSIIIPIALLVSVSKTEGWNVITFILFIAFLFEIAVLHITGFVTIGMSMASYRKDDTNILRKSVRILKFYSIPFYIINFIYSVLAWFVLVGASRGIMIIFVPIPICITYLLIIQSGCVGVFYLKSLNKKNENSIRFSGIHYLLQFIPVLDVMSSIIVIRKTKSN